MEFSLQQLRNRSSHRLTLPSALSLGSLLLGSLLITGPAGHAAETDTCATQDGYQIYQSRNAVARRTSAFLLGSAGLMGMEGYAKVTISLPTENELLTGKGTITGCVANTVSGSLWPNDCTPNGMAVALTNFARIGDIWTQGWAVQAFLGSSGISAAQATIAEALSVHGSPALIPLRGHATEWGVVDKACAQLDTLGHLEDLGALQFHDLKADTTTDLIYGDFQAANLYKVLTKINSTCDPRCTSAPYYNHFIVMYEPPIVGAATFGALPVISEGPRLAPKRPKGIVAPGQPLTTERAATQVFQALNNARFVGTPAVAEARRTGRAPTAYRVRGYGPEGESWEYYVVPIRANYGQGDVLIYVTLAAEDGSLTAVYTPNQPQKANAITEEQARGRGSNLLRAGERLLPAVLTYDVNVGHDSTRAPYQPFYAFPVAGSGGAIKDQIRVALSGEVVGRGSVR